MPANVGSRKRSANADSSAPKKPKATAYRMRRRRPLGAWGGYGPVRAEQAVAYNRKQNNVVSLRKTLFNAIVRNGANAADQFMNYQMATGMPDWTYCKQLFSQYRLRRVKYIFTLIDIVGGDGSAFSNTRMPEIFLRYNEDPVAAAPATQAAMQELANVVSFQFTPERTRIEYIIQPKVMRPNAILSDNANVGYTPTKAPWINVADDTVQHHGLLYYVDYLHSSFRIVVDHEYDMDFKVDQ